jgi:glucan-binding YG repeat protein
MARENRAENRKKAKEGGNGTDIDDRASGDISEFLEADLGGDDEDGEQDPELKGEEESEVEEVEAGKTASESESEKAAPSDVKKEGEEEGKSEEEVEAGKAEAGTKEGEKKPEEKKAEEKPAEAAPADKKPEPAPAEKKAEEKKDEVKQPEALTEEEAGKLYGEWRSTTEALIAEHHYRLTEKDVAEFNENPAVFIPKAMSRVYMDSISAAFSAVHTVSSANG